MRQLEKRRNVWRAKGGIAAMGSGGLLLLALLLVAVFGSLARIVKVPYPILLVISGSGLSLLPQMPRFQLPPDLVFLVFLPPLLYSAAWTLSWREFRRNFKRIAMLAFGLVLATVVLLAWLAPAVLPGFDWKAGLLLGAVVAATDAIAATAVASRMGLPHSLIALLEAESLVNDATGLLALQFGLAILVTGQTPTVGEGILRFLWLTAGGVLLGLLVGYLVGRVEDYIDDGPIEIVLTVLVPYAAYVLGDQLHVSGVMAVIASGMYMSRHSTRFMSAQVRLQATAVWDALTFVLNGVIFLLLGLQLPFVLAEIRSLGVPTGTLVLYGVGFSTAMIALRVAWVFLDAAGSSVLNRLLGRTSGSTLGRRQQAVVGWGGMRGVLSLAAAVSLPLSTAQGPFRQRSMIIFLTFCLIVVTLVAQGLSLPALIRWLGLTGRGGLRHEEQDARRTMLTEALAYLNERAAGEAHEDAVVTELQDAYDSRLAALRRERRLPQQGAAETEARQRLSLEVLEVERATLLRLRNERHIDDEVLRSLQRELDLYESRLSTSAV